MKYPSRPFVLPVPVVALRPQVQPSSCVDAPMIGSVLAKRVMAKAHNSPGLTCVIFPAWVYRVYDLSPSQVPDCVIPLIGLFFLGFSGLFWYGSRTESIRVRRNIALILFVLTSVLFVLSLLIRPLEIMNSLVWINTILYGLLALGYACFLRITPDKS